MNLTLEKVLAKLPMAAITETILSHAKAMAERLLGKRLERVLEQATIGLLTGQTSVVLGIARHNSKKGAET